MRRKRVLVTGASGYVASQMLATLQARYDCVLVDVRGADRDGNPIAGMRIADLTDPDLEANRPLFKGIDAVVHLSYIHPANPQGRPTRDSYYTERRNVDMAFNVYQLSLEEGVQRVVVASSNHAADWYEGLIHAKKKDFVDPWERAISDNYYGWAKEAYEHLGFVFASGKVGRQLEVVQIRIGAPREISASRLADNPNWYHRDLGAYISPRDLTQLFVKSLDADDVRDRHGVPFQIFYGISDNTRKFWSIANAREVIGYEPEDDSEVCFADEIHQHLTSIGTPIPARDFNPGPGTA
jgi:hypothetical protein